MFLAGVTRAAVYVTSLSLSGLLARPASLLVFFAPSHSLLGTQLGRVNTFRFGVLGGFVAFGRHGSAWGGVFPSAGPAALFTHVRRGEHSEAMPDSLVGPFPLSGRVN